MRYSSKVEQHMRAFFDSLSEKDRRCYAAVEAYKLGFGGVEYVSSILNCDGDMIRQGREVIERLPFKSAVRRRQEKRQPYEQDALAGAV